MNEAVEQEQYCREAIDGPYDNDLVDWTGDIFLAPDKMNLNSDIKHKYMLIHRQNKWLYKGQVNNNGELITETDK